MSFLTDYQESLSAEEIGCRISMSLQMQFMDVI
jgi:hypothetical protein